MPFIAETDAFDDHIATGGGEDIQPQLVETPPNAIFGGAISADHNRVYLVGAETRLDARFCMLERALVEIEARLKQAEASSVRAASLSERGAAALFQRMETFERQQIASVKSAIGELGAKLRETSADAAEVPELRQSAGPGLTHAERGLEGDEHDSRAKNASQAGVEPANRPPEQNEYLAAAHRAANAAATLVNLEDRGPATDSIWQTFIRTRVPLQRKHYALAACAAFMMFTAGGSAAFYAGQARGHQMVTQLAAGNAHHAKQFRRMAAVHRAAIDPWTPLAALARAGNAHAQLLLGLDYLRGNGVALSPSIAVEWIHRAAAQREPVAQYWLGTLYEHGDGVAPNSVEAIRWYEAAAAQGNRKAMHALGVAFAQGHGVQQNYAAAAAWFSKAANLGLVNSEFNLGVLYERGLGVPQSLREAYRWYAVAAARGDDESRVRIEALKTQLAGQDIATAQNAAAMFQPQPLVEAANRVPDLAVSPGGTPAHE